MRVIGVMGRNGSGKDEVVDYLHENYKITSISVGDLAREIVQQEGKRPTSENLQEIADRYRAAYGADYFKKRTVQKLEGLDYEVVGVTGIRTPEDVSLLRSRYGTGLLLVHVKVDDARVRFQRVRKRGEPRDPGDYDRFLDQDRKEEELFRLKESQQQADVILSNDGTLEDLHEQIEKKVVAKVRDLLGGRD